MALFDKIAQQIEENNPNLTKIIIDDPNFKVQDVQRLKKLLKINDYITGISIKKHGILPGQYDSLLDLVSSTKRIVFFTCILPLGAPTSMYNKSMGEILNERKESKSCAILPQENESSASLLKA